MSTASPEPERVFTIQPSELPDRYALIVQGAGMEPLLADGACAMFDKDEACKPGDLVIIFLRPELSGRDSPRPMVMRLVLAPPRSVKFPHDDHPDSEARPVVIVEQINPLHRNAIPCAVILAIHKCLGPVPEEIEPVKPTDAEIAALHKRPRRRKRPAVDRHGRVA